VGYGDFGAGNTFELIMTLIWMFLGVSFYSVVVGQITSILTADNDNEDNLNNKLKSLE